MQISANCVKVKVALGVLTVISLVFISSRGQNRWAVVMFFFQSSKIRGTLTRSRASPPPLSCSMEEKSGRAGSPSLRRSLCRPVQISLSPKPSKKELMKDRLMSFKKRKQTALARAISVSQPDLRERSSTPVRLLGSPVLERVSRSADGHAQRSASTQVSGPHETFSRREREAGCRQEFVHVLGKVGRLGGLKHLLSKIAQIR